MSDKDVPDSNVATPNRLLKRGSIVAVRLADGHLADAHVTKVQPNGSINVVFMHQGKEMELTSVAYDPSGTKPDFWQYKS
jgi:hypothetical protein